MSFCESDRITPSLSISIKEDKRLDERSCLDKPNYIVSSENIDEFGNNATDYMLNQIKSETLGNETFMPTIKRENYMIDQGDSIYTSNDKTSEDNEMLQNKVVQATMALSLPDIERHMCAIMKIIDQDNQQEPIFLTAIYKCQNCYATYADLDRIVSEICPMSDTQHLFVVIEVPHIILAQSKRSVEVYNKAVHSSAKNQLTCKYCDANFENIKHFVKHDCVRNRCNSCDHAFIDSESLNEHICLIECSTCGEIFKNRPLVISHEQELHAMKVKCPNCSLTFSDESLLEKHLPRHKLNPVIDSSFRCSHCKFVCLSQEALDEHEKDYARKICPACNAVLNTHCELIQHHDICINCQVENEVDAQKCINFEKLELKKEFNKSDGECVPRSLKKAKKSLKVPSEGKTKNRGAKLPKKKSCAKKTVKKVKSASVKKKISSAILNNGICKIKKKSKQKCHDSGGFEKLEIQKEHKEFDCLKETSSYVSKLKELLQIPEENDKSSDDLVTPFRDDDKISKGRWPTRESSRNKAKTPTGKVEMETSEVLYSFEVNEEYTIKKIDDYSYSVNLVSNKPFIKTELLQEDKFAVCKICDAMFVDQSILAEHYPVHESIKVLCNNYSAKFNDILQKLGVELKPCD